VGIKKKVAIAGGAAAGAVGARALVRASRRERAEHAAEGIAEVVLADAEENGRPRDVVPVGDEAHAPGHTQREIPTHGPGADSQWHHHELAHQQPEFKRRS
jgi:hypothetical protein